MATRRPTARRVARWRTASQKPLYAAVDHGPPVLVRQIDFAPASRGGSWGTFADSFIRFNETALRALDVTPDIVAGNPEPTIRLSPGGRAGAVPLRSAQTGAVVAGLIVRPRFGWAGVGAVMSETGWAASPKFLELPLVPGSARQVPPWVLAGPVLWRLQALLSSMAPGYAVREEVRQSPRGQVVWPRYVSESLVCGAWQRLPCRFPDLTVDPVLRGNIRWALDRLRSQLVSIGHGDSVCAMLVHLTARLLDLLADAIPIRPRTDQLERVSRVRGLASTVLKQGLQALGWVADERGLGGGQEMEGLSWHLPLELLWERYVEARVRDEVGREGGEISVGRLGQTVFPLHWSSNTARSLSHLVPDIVVRRGKAIRIVDAKYKAHFADLDERSWTKLTDDLREAHRADVHQVLAYSALYDSEDITATLIYPLRRRTWQALHERGRDRAQAELFHGSRCVRLELRGLPFGDARGID